MNRPTPGLVTSTRPADDNNVVLTVEGGKSTFRKSVCKPCPWRVANSGDFPAEAFRHSAVTAEDASMHLFSCHATAQELEADGEQRVASEICAGFLLSESAYDNMQVRLAAAAERFDPDAMVRPTEQLHSTYREMAVANGVPEDDPAIAKTMPEYREVMHHDFEAQITHAREDTHRG